MKIWITPDGVVKSIYRDEDQGLAEELGGEVRIRRASDVEPTPDGWTADMAKSGGPILGPFKTRALALAAEVEWLERHALGGADRCTRS